MPLFIWIGDTATPSSAFLADILASLDAMFANSTTTEVAA